MASEHSLSAILPNPLQGEGEPDYTDPRIYHRSKAFTANVGPNPLIADASILFSIVPKLRKTLEMPEPTRLHQHLKHEVSAFENRAQTQGYDSDTLVAAVYIICALIDETIIESSWGKEYAAKQASLLMTLHNDAKADERFFVILDRACKNPSDYIELLEFIYLTLSAGFEGKFRALPRGHEELQLITDQLYQCIRLQRGEFEKALSAARPEKIQKNNTPKRRTPFWLIGLATVCIILGLQTSFNYTLTKTASPLLHQLEK